jgi:hypothetical protein
VFHLDANLSMDLVFQTFGQYVVRTFCIYQCELGNSVKKLPFVTRSYELRGSCETVVMSSLFAVEPCETGLEPEIKTFVFFACQESNNFISNNCVFPGGSGEVH